MVRPRFDLRKHAGLPMVAAASFTYNGKDYEAGDPFPVDDLDPRAVQTMHGARRISFEQDPAQLDRDRLAARRAELLAPAETDPVTVTPQPGGYYLVSAAWLAEPVRVRGKANAEAKAAEVRTEGAPLGFIPGGSAVEITEQGGGWFDVTAPWLDEPEKVQGRQEAEARQREIHDAGEPDTHHGLTLTEGENGWWTITREGAEGELKVQGEQQAREAVATLRAGELLDGAPLAPEPLEVGNVVLVHGGDLDGRKATINSIDGDNAEVHSFGETEETKGELTTATVPLADLTLVRPDLGNPEAAPGAESPETKDGETAPPPGAKPDEGEQS